MTQSTETQVNIRAEFGEIGTDPPDADTNIMKLWMKELEMDWMKNRLKKDVIKPKKPVKIPLITTETLDKMDDAPMDSSGG